MSDSIQAKWDEMLEDIECPNGHKGMLPSGSFEFECPNCDAEGYLDELTGEIRFCNNNTN